MGFRNPVRSLSADQITPGTLPAGVIAQAVRSAAAGNRTILEQNGGSGELRFYAGITGETPASLIATSSGGVAGDQSLTLRGGTNFITESATGAPHIDLYSAQDPDSTWRSYIRLGADRLVGPGLGDTGWLTVAAEYAAGWSGYTGVMNGSPAYNYQGIKYRRRNGYVVLTGAIQKSTGPTVGEVAITLPVGFRPAVPIYGSTITVRPDGTVRVEAVPGFIFGINTLFAAD